MDETRNRERLDYEVVVVGAGPADLSAAIRLKQLAPNEGMRSRYASLRRDPRSARIFFLAR